jgi:hypothetical protein
MAQACVGATQCRRATRARPPAAQGFTGGRARRPPDRTTGLVDEDQVARAIGPRPARQAKVEVVLAVKPLDALEPEIAVEHTDIPERVDRDVLEKMGEQVAAGALPEEPAAAD